MNVCEGGGEDCVRGCRCERAEDGERKDDDGF